MKIVVALALLFPMLASAHDLVAVKKPGLASVLGWLEELATTPQASQQPYIVRVYAAPVSIGECQGTVASCPDVRLFVTVSNGDLGETPVLYKLPNSKGWQFKGWAAPVKSGQTSFASFVVRTTLPDANVEPAARKHWQAREYRVLVSPTSASYAQQ